MKLPKIPEGKPCDDLITQNIRNVKNNKELTAPLSYLNRSCEFKRAYKNIMGEFEKQDKNEKKAYKKAYQQTDKYKAYQKAYKKAYYQTDKYKANKKAYRQTDKYKAYQKAYYQTDKYKANKKAYRQRKKRELKK